MFNCLPGAMLQKGHTHQCKKGFSCSRVPPQHNAWMTASHRLFNPGPPGGKARTRLEAGVFGSTMTFRRVVTAADDACCSRAIRVVVRHLTVLCTPVAAPFGGGCAKPLDSLVFHDNSRIACWPIRSGAGGYSFRTAYKTPSS